MLRAPALLLALLLNSTTGATPELGWRSGGRRVLASRDELLEASTLAWQPAGGGPAGGTAPVAEPAGIDAFATGAALVLTRGNETQAELVIDAAAQAFLSGQPDAAIALAQAVAASMAFGASDSINQAVSDALANGGDFASYFGASLATAAANLVTAVGSAAAAVPAAFAEALAGTAADGYSLAASQTLAAALTASPLLADPLNEAIADQAAAAPSEVLAVEWAQATAAAATRGAGDAAATAILHALTTGGAFGTAYATTLESTGPSKDVCKAFNAAREQAGAAGTAETFVTAAGGSFTSC